MADKGIQVIDRAFDILELLSDEKEGMGVTEIANHIGLNKSTVHRILMSMASRGYIERASGKGVYRNGLKLVDLASVHLNSVELKTEARPFLRELTARMNLATHLAILDGAEAVYIDKVEVESSLRLYSQIGRRISVHCSALGKCLLSGLTDAEVADRLRKCAFKRHTGNTLSTRQALMRQVEAVRLRGYAVDDQEHEEGIRCLASPVRDYRAKVVAAISLTGPATLVSLEREAEIGEMVMQAAREISRRLGHRHETSGQPA
jgi:IclR family transcriptional regulator, KDG regulon repressor